MTMNPKNKKTFRLRTIEEQYEALAALYPERDPETIAAVVLKRRVDAMQAFRRGIPEDYQGAEFANFGYLGDELATLVRSLFEVGGERALLFSGVVGAGKTYAAYAAMNLVLEADPERMVLFEHYPALVQKLRGEFSSDSVNEMGSTWDRVTNGDNDWPGLVILDDIGANKLSEFETEKLYSILDRRLSNHDPIIVTTNVPAADQESVLGARVSSRFERFRRVEFPAHDFRKDV